MNKKFEDVIAEQDRLVYTNEGDSMIPVIREGNLLVIEAVKEPLKVGDIPLYKRDSGQYVLHRIVEIKKGKYSMKGDNRTLVEKGITDKHIIGVLTGIVRNGKTYPVETAQEYITRIAKDMIYPYLDISDWEYGDEPNEPEVFDNTGDGEVTYTYFTDPDCEVKTTEADGAEEEGGVPSFAGTYYLKAEVAETDGYMAGSTVESFKIYERIIDIEWSDGGFVYDGKEHAPEAKITNIVGDDKVELEVSGAEINVGEYEAVADFKEEQRN